MMDVTVNGESMTLEETLTVRALIERLGLGQGPVAVEKNGEVVPRAEHARVAVNAGDVLEILHFVGGG